MIRACRHAVVFLLLLMVGMPVHFAMAQADSAVDAVGIANQLTATNRTAVLLFISNGTINDLLVPVAELRQAATQHLHDHLASSGISVLPSGVMDEIVGRWRVRGDWSLSRPFLEDLVTNQAVAQVQVVHLRAEHSSLSLLTRLIDCRSGQLLSADILSTPLLLPDEDNDAVDIPAWLGSLASLCKLVDPNPERNISGTPLLVLPAEEIGCESDRALMTTISLLKHLLADGNWSVPDPALVNTTLGRSGIDPTRLSPQGRQQLLEQFQTNDLLRLSLVAYNQGNQNNARIVVDDDPEQNRNARFNDFDISLRHIDLQEGIVDLSFNEFSLAKGSVGWFGLAHYPTPLERIDTATQELWQAFNNHSKDH